MSLRHNHRPGRVAEVELGGDRVSMSSRTYRAGTMKEALAQVRRDLGGGAVILGTREVRRRRLFGLGTRELIEVTASGGAAATVTVPASKATAPGALHAQFGE